MNHLTSPVARLAAVALIVALSAVACGRHDSSGPVATNPAPQATQAGPTDSGLVGSPSASVAASSTPAPDQSPAAATTPDPLDSDMQTLDQILGGVDSSLSGSDPGSSGGE